MDPNVVPASEDVRSDLRKGKQDSLALLYQGFLTGIVRLQARRQQLGDPEAFRDRMKVALREVQREATTVGYRGEDIRDAEFAIVAFLDEVILASDEPGRQQWAKQTLAVELFDEAAAGDVFFERLEALKTRTNNQHLADLLEVYALCLLLGFEGRHAGAKGEIHAALDWSRRRIEAIRPAAVRLTPEAIPPVLAPPSPQAPASPIKPFIASWRRALVVVVSTTLVAFILMYLALKARVDDISGLVSN